MNHAFTFKTFAQPTRRNVHGNAPIPPIPPTSMWDPLTTRLGLALLALIPILALTALLDQGPSGVSSVWAKPIRFAVSLGLYLLTLGLYSAYAQPTWRAKLRFRVPVVAGAIAIVMEQLIITMQSARGVDSHFNFSSAFDAALYGAMGIGSLVLTAMMLPVAVGLARHARAGALSDGLRHALVIGLVLSFLLTLVTAGTLAAHGGHAVGAATAHAASPLPLLGWRLDAGDLRAPHFFATHAMHVVPLMAWLLSFRQRVSRGNALLLGALYAVFVLALFGQALSGRGILTFS